MTATVGSPQPNTSLSTIDSGSMPSELHANIETRSPIYLHSPTESRKSPYLPSIQLLLDVLAMMLREILKVPRPTRDSHIFFKILVSLLDKEELNEPLARKLLLPLVSGLERSPLLIEESLPFFELLDIRVIWDIFKALIFENAGHIDTTDAVFVSDIDALRLVRFSISSIKTLCDEECANEILPQFLVSLASLLNVDLLSSSSLIMNILLLMETITKKIPERCLDEKVLASQVTLGHKMLSLLIPFQKSLRESYLKLTPVLENSSTSELSCVQVTHYLIEWALSGIFSQHPSALCLCGCDKALQDRETIQSPQLTMDSVLANELAIHLLEFGLSFRDRSCSSSTGKPQVWSLKIFKSTLKLLSQIWRFVSKKEECAALITIQLPHIWAVFISAGQGSFVASPDDPLALTDRNVCYSALWTLSHLSSAVDNEQLPTIQGHPIFMLDLFFCRYLHDDCGELSFAEKSTLFAKFWVQKIYIPHLKITPAEKALPWTVLKLLESDRGDLLMAEAFDSQERSDSLFEFLVSYFEQIDSLSSVLAEPAADNSNISSANILFKSSGDTIANTAENRGTPATGFSFSMALNLLSRIETLLKDGPTNQFTAMQIFYGKLSCLGSRADATPSLSCNCASRPFLRLLRALAGLSTASFRGRDQSTSLNTTCDDLKLRLAALKVSLSLLVVGSKMINGDGFTGCPALQNVVSGWANNLVSLVDAESDAKGARFTPRDILSQLSAILTLSLCFPTVRPAAWVIEAKKSFSIETERVSCNHPVAILLLKWIDSPAVETAILVELLEFTFSFWGATVLSRWSFFLPLLWTFAQNVDAQSLICKQDKRISQTHNSSFCKGVECFWRIVDFLTGGYQIDGGIKFVTPAPILHAGDTGEFLDRGSLDQDLLLLSCVQKVLTTLPTCGLVHATPLVTRLGSNGQISRHLSFLSLPAPLWVIPVALTTESAPRLLPALLTQQSDVLTASGEFLVKRGIELVAGIVDLHRDLFLVAPKNSLLASAFGSHYHLSQNSKPPASLPPLQQVGVASPTEATLLGIIERILYETPATDGAQFIDAAWNKTGLGTLCRDVLGTLSRRRPSFATTASALLSLLTTVTGIGRWVGVSRLAREAGEIFSKLFEQVLPFFAKAASPPLELVLLSGMTIEGILLGPVDDGIITLAEQEAMVSLFMGNYLMPGIRTALAAFQRAGAPLAAGCLGGRCVGHSGCLLAHKKVHGLGSPVKEDSHTAICLGDNDSVNLKKTTYQMYVQTDERKKITCDRGLAGDLHAFLSLALMLLQRMPSTASFTWRRELLESLFLETSVRFFALPLYHWIDGVAGGRRCWCLRRALVATMSSSLVAGGSNSLGDGTAVEILSLRNKGSASSSASSSVSSTMSFFSTLLGRSGSSTVSTEGSHLPSFAVATLEPSSLATIRAVRRLAYAMLSASSSSSLLFASSAASSSLFLPQIHEKVAELFRVVRSMDHYQVEASSSAISHASLLMDALFLLFRVLVLRFERIAMQDKINGGGQTTSSIARGDAADRTPAVLLNSPSMLLAWWPTLNAELLYYIGKISGLTAKEKEESSKRESGASIQGDLRSEPNPKASHGRLLFKRSARPQTVSAASRDRLNATVLSDLVSICKLLELLLKSGVEELRLHSWWLFGPTGTLASLFDSIVRENGDEEAERTQKANNDDGPKETSPFSPVQTEGSPISISSPASAVKLSCFGTEETPRAQLASFLRLATKGWCSRSDGGTSIFNKTRTCEGHREYVELVEHFLLEEEFSNLEGGGLPVENADV